MAPPFSRNRIHQAALQLFAERGTADISISDLAEAAGVARGTIYNNISQPEELFGQVAADLASEMFARSVASMVGVTDPATRLALGIRMFARRAHEEPYWGRFIVRFSLSDERFGQMLGEPPMMDAARAIETGRYKLDPGYLMAAVGMIGGAGLSAMRLVLDGSLTWRDAGTQTAEMLLRGFGIAAREAHAIATMPLPPLIDTPSPQKPTQPTIRKTEKARKPS
jgi:AcrR family transcriptional regulator